MRQPSNLAEAWWAFSIDVIDPEASALQVKDMRNAFYGGALALLGLHRQGVALEDLRAELEDFVGAVAKEAAP